jgi:hypothetical protein
MVAGDLLALLTTIVSPPHCLGKVCRHEISPTPLQLLLRDLLGQDEASQLLLHARRLTNSENVV